MKVHSLLDRLKPKRNTAPKIIAVVQPTALYFYSDSSLSIDSSVEIANGSWQDTLVDTLSRINASAASLDLVLDHDNYQIFQIEKPSLPEDEWSSALPFLLKDLVSDKVTDIVAQAIPLPTGNKIQAFVTSKKRILDLVAKLSGLQISLDRILVEEEVWGHCGQDLKSFLMLQRSVGGSFKISAFIDGVSVFQRSIRGVASPLTGVAAGPLQMDSMALELQRSIDYLSSQHRNTTLHRLLICCDEEEQEDLAQLLGQSISVSVSVLDESERLSGEVLATRSIGLKTGIDLYPDELKPVKEFLTLSRMVSAWAVIAILFTGASLYLGNQATQLHQQLTIINGERAQLTAEKSVLNEQLAKHKPSPEKQAAVERLTKQIQDMKNTLSTVDTFNGSQDFGYSGVMGALASLGREDISLQYISVEKDQLDLKGLALEAKSVPNWVNQFKQELNLVGRTFDKLTLALDDNERVTFELLTRKEEDE